MTLQYNFKNIVSLVKYICQKDNKAHIGLSSPISNRPHQTPVNYY